MDRLTVTEVLVAESDIEAYQYQGDDGYPAGRSFRPVCCTTADGRKWFLPQGEHRRDDEGFPYIGYRYHDAERVAARVRAHGSIDPELWIEVEEINLEESWGPEAAFLERSDALFNEAFYMGVNYHAAI